jgi:hypothetical protein
MFVARLRKRAVVDLDDGLHAAVAASKAAGHFNLIRTSNPMSEHPMTLIFGGEGKSTLV